MGLSGTTSVPLFCGYEVTVTKGPFKWQRLGWKDTNFKFMDNYVIIFCCYRNFKQLCLIKEDIFYRKKRVIC